jgi:hypothetical protein
MDSFLRQPLKRTSSSSNFDKTGQTESQFVQPHPIERTRVTQPAPKCEKEFWHENEKQYISAAARATFTVRFLKISFFSLISLPS